MGIMEVAASGQLTWYEMVLMVNAKAKMMIAELATSRFSPRQTV